MPGISGWFFALFKAGQTQGYTGQQHKWRKGCEGLERRRDQVSDGGRGGRQGWIWACRSASSELAPTGAGGCGQRDVTMGNDHISREALHLARVLLSKITLMGSCSSLPCGGRWDMARALLQRKLAAARARLWRKFPRRVPDGVRSAAKAADGGSQPRWTWWRVLRRLQRALVLPTETPQYGKLFLKLQSSVISSCPCDFHPPKAMGSGAHSGFPQPPF